MPQEPLDSRESRKGKSASGLRRGHTIVVLGIALALRLLVIVTVLKHYPPQWLFTRGIEMGLLARSLLARQGLSSPFGGSTGPTAFIAPVYPILVALIFKIFGSFTTTSAIVVMLAQLALNLLTIGMMMHVAWRLFNQAAATVAGLIWACSLPLIWMPTIFWETSLSCCLLMGLLALVLRYRELETLNPIHWVRLGAYCGFAALVNPALLLALVAISLWLWSQKRRNAAWWPMLTALTFAVVFAPWPIRNAEVFHAFIPLRTTVGFELWMGNHAGADGFLDETLFPMYNRAELADYVARGEVAYSAHKSELAKEYVASHRGTFVRMTAVRLKRFWTGTGSRNGSGIFAIHASFTTAFGFCRAMAAGAFQALRAGYLVRPADGAVSSAVSHHSCGVSLPADSRSAARDLFGVCGHGTLRICDARFARNGQESGRSMRGAGGGRRTDDLMFCAMPVVETAARAGTVADSRMRVVPVLSPAVTLRGWL